MLTRVGRRILITMLTAIMSLVLLSQAALAAPVQPQRDPPSINAAYNIMADAYSTYGHYVPLRKGFYPGTGAFGLAKVAGKHHIYSMDAFRFVLASPEFNRETSTGTTWRHYAYADEITCDRYECVLSDSRQVKLVQDQRLLSDGEPFGLVTMYCLDPNAAFGVEREVECPAWVDVALVAGWNSGGSGMMSRSAEVSGPRAPSTSGYRAQHVTYVSSLSPVTAHG